MTPRTSELVQQGDETQNQQKPTTSSHLYKQTVNMSRNKLKT